MIEQEDQVLIEHEEGCGPKTLQLAYARLGLKVSQAQLVNELGTDESGTRIENIKKNILDHDFYYREYTNTEWDHLVESSKNSQGLIVVWTEPDDEEGHYSLVQEVTEDRIKLAGYKDMDREDFEDRWWDWEKTDKEYLVYERWLLLISKRIDLL